jgi:hypothetical protein
MDVILLLKSQHRRIEELLSKIANTEGPEKHQVFREMLNWVVAHDTVERELFYPACERTVGEDQLARAGAEHGLMAFSLYRCELERRNPGFDVHLRILKEAIEHHVLAEESELFVRVEQALDAAARSSLGERVARRFDVVLATDGEAALRDCLKEVLGDSFSPRTKRAGDKKLATRRTGARFAR